MTAESIPLRFAGAGRSAYLRELTGCDEMAVCGTSTVNAIRLLSALLVYSSPDETKQLCAVDLVAADRDRLLAAVYEGAFGDRIESTLKCTRCAQPFDLHFSLRQLIETVDERTDDKAWRPLDDGELVSPDGLRFRLPTGKDELELAGFPPREMESLLLRRCIEGGNWLEDCMAFEEFLEQVAPLLDLELIASCAECGHVHTVQFDIQSYVLGAILAERRRLMAEINRIAKAYAWSLDEILSLRRSDRRCFVELIENEHAS
jgi:hypothetical protein